MRQHVPNLDTNLTNNDFLDLIVSCFHSAIFGTVDQNGEPHTNIVDIDFNEDGRLIFAASAFRPLSMAYSSVISDVVGFTAAAGVCAGAA